MYRSIPAGYPQPYITAEELQYRDRRGHPVPFEKPGIVVAPRRTSTGVRRQAGQGVGCGLCFPGDRVGQDDGAFDPEVDRHRPFAGEDVVHLLRNSDAEITLIGWEGRLFVSRQDAVEVPQLRNRLRDLGYLGSTHCRQFVEDMGQWVCCRHRWTQTRDEQPLGHQLGEHRPWRHGCAATSMLVLPNQPESQVGGRLGECGGFLGNEERLMAHTELPHEVGPALFEFSVAAIARSGAVNLRFRWWGFGDALGQASASDEAGLDTEFRIELSPSDTAG